MNQVLYQHLPNIVVCSNELEIRNSYIDALLKKGIGGVLIKGNWTPIFDLSNSELVSLYILECDYE